MKFYKSPSKSKYRNKRVSLDGIWFDSQDEAQLYLDFKLQEKLGLIEIEKIHDQVRLTDSKILMKPDFKLRDLNKGTPFWAEFKGHETTDYKIKKRLWKNYGPGPLLVFKRVKGRIIHVETVVPENSPKKRCSTCAM